MKSNWISVKDRLPEKGIEVLVSYLNPNGTTRSVEVAKYTKCPEEYDWSSNKEDTLIGGYLWIEGKPTHWMPLPEPPKQ